VWKKGPFSGLLCKGVSESLYKLDSRTSEAVDFMNAMTSNGLIEVSGIQLYHEVRGSAVLRCSSYKVHSATAVPMNR
jgi:hypothetical protein